MSLEPLSNTNNKIPITNRSSVKSSGTSNSGTNTAISDSVDTQIADKIKTALTSAAASPAVDSDRVSNIKQAIQDGTYTVDADRLAAKILQFENKFPVGET